MLKFTSVSGSGRAITDIILTVIITRTDLTTGPIITVPITGPTMAMGTVDIVIIAGIIILIIIGANLIGIATPGWLEPISSQPNFFELEV